MVRFLDLFSPREVMLHNKVGVFMENLAFIIKPHVEGEGVGC